MLAPLLLFLLPGDFQEFVAELKQKPPACPLSVLDFPVERPAAWSEHFGPRLIVERSVQLAPGVAVISGRILEIGPPHGLRDKKVRVVAVFYRGAWAIHHSECETAARGKFQSQADPNFLQSAEQK